jgi:hypothetical protein
VQVQKVLHQNILPKLEALPEYQQAMASYLLRREQA